MKFPPRGSHPSAGDRYGVTDRHYR